MTAETWLSALQGLLQPSVILYLFAGIAIGTFIGALPGLSATMGIAIMTPITFWLDILLRESFSFFIESTLAKNIESLLLLSSYRFTFLIESSLLSFT